MLCVKLSSLPFGDDSKPIFGSTLEKILWKVQCHFYVPKLHLICNVDLYYNNVYNICHPGLLYIVRAPDHGKPESTQNSSHQKFNSHLGVSPCSQVWCIMKIDFVEAT
jgi:hypothetical protein